MATRENIQTALLELLKEKPLNLLTVKEIAYQAGMGRRTFYSYFSSVEEAAKSCLSDLKKTLAKKIASSEKKDPGTVGSILFEHWSENRDLLRLIINNTNINTYEYFIDLMDFLDEMTGELFPRTGKNQSAYLNTYVIGGAYSLFLRWITEENAPKAEEMTEMFTFIIIGLVDFTKEMLE